MKKVAVLFLALSCGSLMAQSAPWVRIAHYTCPGPVGSAWPATTWQPAVIGPVANYWQNSFTNSTANAYCDGSGNFVIAALNPGGSTYTSGYYTTGKILSGQSGTPSESWQYAWINVTMTLPYASGIWPAAFLIDQRYINQVNWGEIDFAEMFGSTSSEGSQSIHTINQSSIAWNAASACEIGPTFDTIPSGGSVTGSHTYGVQFIPNNIRYYIDGTLLNSEFAGSFDGCTWQQNDSYYLAIDLAVGATGSPAGVPSGTSFPQTMSISAVDVWVLPLVSAGQSLSKGQKAP